MTKDELLLFFNNKSKINSLENLMNSVLSMNEKFNLTAIKNHEDFRELMIYDSLVPLSHIDFDDKSVLDVGTGAGFPGLPLAICSKGNFTLLDSTKKKIDFINNYAKENKIANVKGINARAEEYAISHREEYDYVISRAVAGLPILIELCFPMVKVGGFFLAMKSNKAQEEINLSQRAIKLLGGEIVATYNDFLPISKESRTLIVIKKNSVTNKKYPRRFDQIKSKPL